MKIQNGHRPIALAMGSVCCVSFVALLAMPMAMATNSTQKEHFLSDNTTAAPSIEVKEPQLEPAEPLRLLGATEVVTTACILCFGLSTLKILSNKGGRN